MRAAHARCEFGRAENKLCDRPAQPADGSARQGELNAVKRAAGRRPDIVHWAQRGCPEVSKGLSGAHCARRPCAPPAPSGFHERSSGRVFTPVSLRRPCHLLAILSTRRPRAIRNPIAARSLYSLVSIHCVVASSIAQHVARGACRQASASSGASAGRDDEARASESGFRWSVAR